MHGPLEAWHGSPWSAGGPGAGPPRTARGREGPTCRRIGLLKQCAPSPSVVISRAAAAAGLPATRVGTRRGDAWAPRHPAALASATSDDACDDNRASMSRFHAWNVANFGTSSLAVRRCPALATSASSSRRSRALTCS